MEGARVLFKGLFWGYVREGANINVSQANELSRVIMWIGRGLVNG